MIMQEATSLGVLPSVSFNKIPLFFETTELPKNVAEVNTFFGGITFTCLYKIIFWLLDSKSS